MSVFDRIQTRVETPRLCGYRVEGGEYVVSQGKAIGCGKLPLSTLCKCCNDDIPFFRGTKMLWNHRFINVECRKETHCQSCQSVSIKQRVMIMWVGQKFYPTPNDFIEEAEKRGVSKRLNGNLPNEFVVGETFVFFGHRKAILKGSKPIGEKKAFAIGETIIYNRQWQPSHVVMDGAFLGTMVQKKNKDGSKIDRTHEVDQNIYCFVKDHNGHIWIVEQSQVNIKQESEPIYEKGLFYAFKPTAIEYVVKGTETEQELLDKEKRGFTLVKIVPDTKAQFDLFALDSSTEEAEFSEDELEEGT